MSQNTDILPKAYDPSNVEAETYRKWEESNCFHADENSNKPPFCIVIPPPNVTGMLTMGHVLNNTLQDILIRYHRMLGRETLWLPGTDHAGIATQNVVEKALAKEKVSRHDLGREKFLDKVWAWREKYGGIILSQLKRLGCSCDWERERFTMDEGLSEAVKKCFIKLHKDGLIYKGKYIINWCPRCRT
ncbi:MAG: valyl-tRNA synthetase, partial [Clostridiales bacterium]|nr:valyl-tRNA synthetase [Clostridiales bacterium]MDN5283494.1 valyl-tRNA synthetase [Candidatus Ozemobacter sp.]